MRSRPLIVRHATLARNFVLDKVAPNWVILTTYSSLPLALYSLNEARNSPKQIYRVTKEAIETTLYLRDELKKEIKRTEEVEIKRRREEEEKKQKEEEEIRRKEEEEQRRKQESYVYHQGLVAGTGLGIVVGLGGALLWGRS